MPSNPCRSAAASSLAPSSKAWTGCKPGKLAAAYATADGNDERAARMLRPGEILLAEARAQGADLLIKGAYTQSRFRQMIFGGATRHVLAAAELPVLLAH
jgi:nucleotide-binding universal stress UspA family protein